VTDAEGRSRVSFCPYLQAFSLANSMLTLNVRGRFCRLDPRPVVG